MPKSPSVLTYQDAVDLLKRGCVKIDGLGNIPHNDPITGKPAGNSEGPWEYIIPASVSPEDAANVRAIAEAVFGITVPSDSRRFRARALESAERDWLVAMGALDGVFLHSSSLAR